MKVGFTGTYKGLSIRQRMSLREELEKCEGQFHHGDCIGSDAQAHDIARKLGYFIHIHPPENSSKRAFKQGDIISKELPYLLRNHNIVDQTDLLIATPKEEDERLRSGTWATIRYAQKQRKKITIIYPDGRKDKS